jgi:hypothetical protein
LALLDIAESAAPSTESPPETPAPEQPPPAPANPTQAAPGPDGAVPEIIPGGYGDALSPDAIFKSHRMPAPMSEFWHIDMPDAVAIIRGYGTDRRMPPRGYGPDYKLPGSLPASSQ